MANTTCTNHINYITCASVIYEECWHISKKRNILITKYVNYMNSLFQLERDVEQQTGSK